MSVGDGIGDAKARGGARKGDGTGHAAHGGERPPGPSTRAVHAGRPGPEQGTPFLPGPTFAAPVHWAGDAAPEGYGRAANPTWTAYERALGELEEGQALAFASGMAAVAAVLLPALVPGDVLVLPTDGYYAVRQLAREHLEPRGIHVRAVPSDTDALCEAAAGATLVWAETPSNPWLKVIDLPRLAQACRAAGVALAVDATLATPLRVRPLEHGADWVVASATKALSGHGDLLLGYVATRDQERLQAARRWRTTTGAIPGPFETWLAHRSLPTLALRLERQEAGAAALVAALRERADVDDVRWPGLGPVMAFTLPSAEAAQRFLAATTLVAEATSFGGVHSSAERRARWGADDVPDGFVRLAVGIEDPADLVADVVAALEASLRG